MFTSFRRLVGRGFPVDYKSDLLALFSHVQLSTNLLLNTFISSQFFDAFGYDRFSGLKIMKLILGDGTACHTLPILEIDTVRALKKKGYYNENNYPDEAGLGDAPCKPSFLKFPHVDCIICKCLLDVHDNPTHMILDPKHRGKIKVIWSIVCLIVILGMVLFSASSAFF